MDSEELLNQLRVFDDIFYIGAFQPPITFLSQQNRALNFVWSLQQSSFAIENASICVIGAGLAGLTTSSALRALGANVTLLERTCVVMPLQQGNSSRYVLPHLFEWPTAGSAYPRTHLPFLNWSAGSAGNIASDILAQWDRTEIEPEYAVTVQRVRRINDRPTIMFPDRDSRAFDAIVIAAGFGLENAHLSRHTPHYWRNDDFDQPFIKDDVFSCLVSGTGDGGLIDALRVATRDFRHGDFLSWIVGNEWIRLQAESIRNRLNVGENADVVWRDFLSLSLPGNIDAHIRRWSRPRTSVTLLGRGSTPMHGRALLSTQMVVAMFLKLELINYRQGNLQNVEKRGRDNFRVRIATVSDEKNSETLSFDRVITRVGPTNVLQKMIGAERFMAMSQMWPAAGQDQSAIPAYDVAYLKDEFMLQNQETRFEVWFALGTFADSGQPIANGAPADTVARLNVLGTQLGLNNLSEQFTIDGINFHASESLQIWNTRPCTFRLSDGAIQTPRGSCAGPIIIVETNHRSLLDTLLNNDPLPYQVLSIGVTGDVINAGHLEPARDLETNVFVQDLRETDGTLRLVSHLGMFQAHRLFSVQDLVSILRNEWVTNRIHNLGWLISAPAQHLRDHWTI